MDRYAPPDTTLLHPAAFRGRVLDDEEDHELQRIVSRAARATRSPIAFVSLVLNHCQVFRAHHGLPDELRTLKATDRDLAFDTFASGCNELFEVTNAQGDTGMPAELVERYGMRSCLSAPVYVDDQAVGYLCVIDRSVREFTEAEKERLQSLAEQASLRLTVLAGRPELTLLARASRPAFAEAHNILQALQWNTQAARFVRSELAPLTRLQELSPEEARKAPLKSLVANASEVVRELDEILTEIEEGSDKLNSTIAALEVATGSTTGENPCLSSLLEQARLLALHDLNASGEFRWPVLEQDPLLSTSEPDSVAALAALLSELGRWAKRNATTLQPSVRVEGTSATVGFRLDPKLAFDLPDLVESIQRLVDETPGVHMQCEAERIGLGFEIRV